MDVRGFKRLRIAYSGYDIAFRCSLTISIPKNMHAGNSLLNFSDMYIEYGNALLQLERILSELGRICATGNAPIVGLPKIFGGKVRIPT